MKRVYIVSYRHDGDDTHVSGIMRVFEKEEDASEYVDFLLDRIKKIVKMDKSKVRDYIFKNIRTDLFDITATDDWAEAAEGNYHFHVYYEEHEIKEIGQCLIEPQVNTAMQYQRSFLHDKIERDIEKQAYIKRMQTDRAFVISEVKKNGLKLEYASDEFKSDIDVVLTAVNNNCNAIYDAKGSTLSDISIAKVVVFSNPSLLSLFSYNVKDNVDVVRIACNRRGYALKYASDRIKKFPEILGELKKCYRYKNNCGCKNTCSCSCTCGGRCFS